MQNDDTTDPIVPVTHAAYVHVDALVAQADGHEGASPWWHGWAVREAFEAGAEWQRSQAVVDPKWAKMDPTWVVDFLEKETNFDVAVIERMLQFAIDAAQHSTKSK
ncbi:hypothetical protein [Pseudomonas viridiflava]|uniref:hypothetical protein n=1 Tax=Pseudomonas viridiflava TaxID=33069 RepID=UPI000F062F8A|nr:hypothetical protein [Pseudomonas viridiflava]